MQPLPLSHQLHSTFLEYSMLCVVCVGFAHCLKWAHAHKNATSQLLMHGLSMVFMWYVCDVCMMVCVCVCGVCVCVCVGQGLGGYSTCIHC